MTRDYKVTGMMCAVCVQHVEKAVRSVPGVTDVNVSLLTNSMKVEGEADPKAVSSAVKKAGYGAKVLKPGKGGSAEDVLRDTETPKMIKRLVFSVVVLLVLMYITMGHVMWGWPVPAFLSHKHYAIGWIELVLSAVIIVINKKFFVNGFMGIIHRALNMDTLVAMGSGVSFVYSLFGLAQTGIYERAGESELAMECLHNLYFESAAMILVLITVGKTLESYSKGRTTDALKSLMKLRPDTAVVLRDGKEISVPVSEVKAGDIFVVRAGESIPVDGIVVKGNGSVNEAALTGESIPVDKEEGSEVWAATVNTSGFLTCRAERVGEDTTLSKIIDLVRDAAATKAPIAALADKVAGIFVPTVIIIAAITFVIWMLCGQEFSFSLSRAISVLVISCPCSLGLATPVAIMVGNGKGARAGILFKTAASLEGTGRVHAVALDKTGTITRGMPVVTDIIPSDGHDKDELMLLAYSVEKGSEHPLARAVTQKAEELGIKALDVGDFKTLSGNGLSGMIEGKRVVAGKQALIESETGKPFGEKELATAKELSAGGKTPLFFARDGELVGTIAVADSLKEGAHEAIEQLKEMGIKTVMITGDRRETAEAIGKAAGVSEIRAEVLPDGKEKIVRELCAQYKTAMVGDGINDAPALTRADIGIAVGAGSDVALDAADVVLVGDNILDIPAAIRLGRKVLRVIKQNLFWAFFYNVICIPLAAGVWYNSFGITLNPMICAAAMSFSSIFVVCNALRLNLMSIKK